MMGAEGNISKDSVKRSKKNKKKEETETKGQEQPSDTTTENLAVEGDEVEGKHSTKSKKSKRKHGEATAVDQAVTGKGKKSKRKRGEATAGDQAVTGKGKKRKKEHPEQSGQKQQTLGSNLAAKFDEVEGKQSGKSKKSKLKCNDVVETQKQTLDTTVENLVAKRCEAERKQSNRSKSKHGEAYAGDQSVTRKDKKRKKEHPVMLEEGSQPKNTSEDENGEIKEKGKEVNKSSLKSSENATDGGEEDEVDGKNDKKKKSKEGTAQEGIKEKEKMTDIKTLRATPSKAFLDCQRTYEFFQYNVQFYGQTEGFMRSEGEDLYYDIEFTSREGAESTLRLCKIRELEFKWAPANFKDVQATGDAEVLFLPPRFDFKVADTRSSLPLPCNNPFPNQWILNDKGSATCYYPTTVQPAPVQPNPPFLAQGWPSYPTYEYPEETDIEYELPYYVGTPHLPGPSQNTLRMGNAFSVPCDNIQLIIRLLASRIPLVCGSVIGRAFGMVTSQEIYDVGEATTDVGYHSVVLLGHGITHYPGNPTEMNKYSCDSWPMNPSGVKGPRLYYRCRGSWGDEIHPKGSLDSMGGDFNLWADGITFGGRQLWGFDPLELAQFHG